MGLGELLLYGGDGLTLLVREVELEVLRARLGELELTIEASSSSCLCLSLELM